MSKTDVAAPAAPAITLPEVHAGAAVQSVARAVLAVLELFVAHPELGALIIAGIRKALEPKSE